MFEVLALLVIWIVFAFFVRKTDANYQILSLILIAIGASLAVISLS